MRRLLSHPRAPVILALLGVLCCLPALGVGLVGDDYYHRQILLGEGTVGEGADATIDLFELMPTMDTPRAARLAEAGMYPWWTHPDLNVDLLRPVTSLTHQLDYAVWPDSFPLQHLHSLLWYGALVVLVGLLYRKVHPAAAVTAGLATLLFAVEDAHSMPAGWLANRHAVVSGVLGVGALLLHQRWRQGGRPAWFVAAIGLFVVALFSGEAALGVAAYLFAWEATLAKGTWGRRFAALVPYGLAIVGWRILYDLGGHGTAGSALYLDPGRDPLAFAVVLLERWPILQAGQWGQLPIDVALYLSPAASVGFAGFSAVCVLLLGIALWPLLRDRPEARFWALGSALAMIPLAAAFPMDRLLMFGGVGAFGLMAMMAERWGPWLAGADRVRSARRFLVAILLIVHIPLAGLMLAGRMGVLSMLHGMFASGDLTAPADEPVAQQDLVFVTGQDFPVVYLQVIREVDGVRPSPRAVTMLSSLSSDCHVLRESEHTLVLTPTKGFLLTRVDRLLRSLDVPFEQGERIARPGYEAEVRAVSDDGRPAQVAFRFEAPLSDRRYRWLHWAESGAVEFELPAVGESVMIPAVFFVPQ
jgi:hypothetical protein